MEVLMSSMLTKPLFPNANRTAGISLFKNADAPVKPSTQAAINPSPAVQPDTKPKRKRGKTIHMKRLTREERMETEAILLDLGTMRKPETRAECATGQRPCPFVSCKYHLYLDVNPNTGSIKINFPHVELWEMKETCALDIADKGGTTLEEVGVIVNLTRERIRQVEALGLEKLKEAGLQVGMDTYLY
jgi:hypothetical protein